MNNIENLTRSGLFAGIMQNDIEEMLHCFSAVCKKYEKGEMVIWEGDTVNDVGIVLSGSARTTKTDISGKLVIVTLLNPGSYIGVLLAASHERKSPVSVQALESLSVLFIPVRNMLKLCNRLCLRHERLLQNLIDGVAEKALVLHDRNDCLIKPTIRDKILTYLMRIYNETGHKAFTIPFDREAMAEYLNVDRSALSRELSWMKKDGLIDFYKNNFKLLQIDDNKEQ